jgi:hypothetical protein
MHRKLLRMTFGPAIVTYDLNYTLNKKINTLIRNAEYLCIRLDGNYSLRFWKIARGTVGVEVKKSKDKKRNFPVNYKNWLVNYEKELKGLSYLTMGTIKKIPTKKPTRLSFTFGIKVKKVRDIFDFVKNLDNKIENRIRKPINLRKNYGKSVFR